VFHNEIDIYVSATKLQKKVHIGNLHMFFYKTFFENHISEAYLALELITRQTKPDKGVNL